jgi:hypothetical protein
MQMTDARPSAKRLRRRFRNLAARLGRTDWILLGTIHERRIPAPGRIGRMAKTYGPYYQWTFKRQGRTITVNLSAAQVSAFRTAIRRQRAVEALLDEMRSISRRFLEATTPGVLKRNPRT